VADTQAPVASDAPQQDTSFDSAFAEFAGGKDQTEAETPQSRVEEEAQPSPGEGAQASTEGEAGKAAAAPSTEKAPAAAGASEPAKTTIDWSKAPPEYKAAFDALQHEAQSNRGRINAFQRQIAELKAPKPAAPKAPAFTLGADGKPSFMSGDRWKEFSDAYPDIAAPIADAFGAISTEALNLREELKPVVADRQTQAHLEQQELLGKQHPDWETVAYSDGFKSWIAGQPAFIQEAFARNGKAIVDAEEAGHVISLFKGSQTPAQPPAATVTNLSDKRQKQLESGKTAPDKGPGAASGAPSEFDDAFAYFAAKRAAARR